MHVCCARFLPEEQSMEERKGNKSNRHGSIDDEAIERWTLMLILVKCPNPAINERRCRRGTTRGVGKL